MTWSSSPPEFDVEELDDHLEEQSVADRGDGGLSSLEKKKALANVFVFAQPVAIYEGILKSVVKAQNMTHLIVLTRTSHPSLLVAGRRCGLETIAFVEKVSPHSMGHGEELLRKMTTMAMMVKAKALVQKVGTKRVSVGSLTFITAQNVPNDLVAVKDIEIDVSKSWRAGFNKNPMDLEAMMVKLFHAELEANNLYLAQDAQGMLSLHTSIARKEGDAICPLTCLLFDSASMLEGFLSTAGNKLLIDKLVKIPGVFMSEEDGRVDIFAALVGVGRFLRHFLGLRKAGPNVAIVPVPAAGATDGFLTLVTQTRNNVGIAAKNMLVANFGAEYDHSVKPEVDEPDVKKFKGALDSYFKKIKVSGPEEDKHTEEDAQKSKAGKEGGEQGQKRKAEGGEEGDSKGSQKDGQEDGKTGSGEGDQKGQGSASGGVSPGSGSSDGATPGSKLEDGATLIASVANIGVQLVLNKDGALALRTASGVTTNKKVLPKTILWLNKVGKVSKAPGPLEWNFSSSPKKIFVASTAGVLSTLAEFIEKGNSVGIQKHTPEKFPAGNPPSSLTCENPGLHFIPEAGTLDALNAAKSLSMASLVWACGNKDSKAISVAFGKQT